MITKAYIQFFKELEKNNHKEWFHANKKTYEKEVKEPFTGLVNDLIEVLKGIDPEIPGLAKDIMMRINKDIRFSKDKTPYNLLMKANFTPGGRKSNNPGFYLAIGADNIHVGGGIYHAQPADLKRIRTYLLNNESTAKSLISDPHLLKYFGEVKGEKAKRTDKEFMEKAEALPFIMNKQFFYMKQTPSKDFVDQPLIPFLQEHFKAAGQFHHFFRNALKS